MISRRAMLRHYHQITAKKSCKNSLIKSRRHTSWERNHQTVSTLARDGTDHNSAVVAAVVMTAAALTSSWNEFSDQTSIATGANISSSRICQCDAVSNPSVPIHRSPTNRKPVHSNSQPRNVMVHRLRSSRGRNLNEKYNVDWKTVLGEGAYGSVHPARLAATGEKVALKKITKRYTNTSSFCRETDALLRIYNNGGHPNISGLRDMYEDYDHYYLVMDLVSGGEMFDHLINFGAYSEADAARLMREVASALAFLHGVGVIHADLKPENLLLCSKKREDGTVKIIDFGCALVMKDNVDDNDCQNETSYEDDLSLKGRLSDWIGKLQENTVHNADSKELQFTGTTAYWPPERFSTKSFPDAATDMWAVGIILFIMLTGVHPFDLTGVATDAEIEEQIKKDPSAPITPALTSHLSPSAIDLIKRLFTKDPNERISADEMLSHPWIGGNEATTEIIEKSDEKLSKFKDLKAIIEAGIFSILVEQGSRDMLLSEYTPQMMYKDDRGKLRGAGGKRSEPATSVLKRAFEVFDSEGKGFVSADDMGRVVNTFTGQKLSEKEKKDMLAATTQGHEDDSSDTMSAGLSLSKFSTVFAGLKHKHYPRGHIIFHAGDEGDTMYFINSGKVEIQTRKGQLVHILRHGDFFGEGSLLEVNNKRFSTAKCATPVDVIKIKRSDFEKYINNSQLAKNTLKFRWKARTLADAKALIRLQTNLKTRLFHKGDVVYKEGDKGNSMFFVDEETGGDLDVKHGDVIVHKYMQGESFGESSLLLERPRSSTVTCASDTCYLHEMMNNDFMEFLETSPDTKAMLLNMCRKRLFKKAVKSYSLTHKRGFSNEDLTKAFQEADLDRSGDLGLDEVRKLMHAMDPSIREDDIVELMKFIDVDEDGKLNFDDFKRLFRSFSFDSHEEAYQ